MSKGEIVWRIALLILGVLAIFAYLINTEQDIKSAERERLSARYDAFLLCSKNSPQTICAQLFGE